MISVFDIFKIGIGPSSSHTVGPMSACLMFTGELGDEVYLVEKVRIDLYGSLALTKSGHGTDIALMLGLCGYTPKEINPNKIDGLVDRIRKDKKLRVNFKKNMNFNENSDIVTHKTEELPYHPNGMIITAYNKDNKVILTKEYYSVGGGFVEEKENFKNKNKDRLANVRIPNDFNSWSELSTICKRKKKDVWEIVQENEKTLITEDKIDEKISLICKIMKNSISNGLKRRGYIRGGLNLARRSGEISENIKASKDKNFRLIDNLLLWGMAVGEENASYGQVVTAPTNGAAGVITATINYYSIFHKKIASFLGFKKFILTAGAVGILCKRNASISGAEGGCQAEIGSATAMAAAGLCAALGGSTEQCENAAIIGLSHNLGLTCDPIGGLVQIPCIERNAINTVKAVAACRLAMLEKESIYLRLDQIIETMRDTGRDMPNQYKETAIGGLAKNAKVGRHHNCGNCEYCS